MARNSGSQRRELMQQKEEHAVRLLARGLTIRQVCVQLNCSQHFVRQIFAEQRTLRLEAIERAKEAGWDGIERRGGLERRRQGDRRARARVPRDRRSGVDRRNRMLIPLPPLE